LSSFRRLFKDHWGATLAFGVAWFVLAAVAIIGPEDSRHPSLGPPLLFMMALTVLVSFAWANSRHYQQVGSAPKKLFLTWGAALADLAVFAILFSIPAVVLAPAYGKYTIRSQMGQMVSAAGELKTPIMEAAAAKGSLSGAAKGIRVRPVKNADYLQVGPDGVIVAYNERHGALVVLTPVMSAGGEILWRCQGRPERFFPSSCRGDAAK